MTPTGKGRLQDKAGNKVSIASTLKTTVQVEGGKKISDRGRKRSEMSRVLSETLKVMMLPEQLQELMHDLGNFTFQIYCTSHTPTH